MTDQTQTKPTRPDARSDQNGSDRIGLKQKEPDQKGAKKAPVGQLRRLVPFLKPYKPQIALAGLALSVAALSVLLFGQGLRRVIDSGFALGSLDGLTRAITLVFLTVIVLAGATFARFYAVSRLGERLVADLRKAVFSNLLRQSPAFFEKTKVGEITSRITTDTTLIQTVVGSSVSIALRNVLLTVGGTVMLLITSLKLTAVLFLVLPLVLLPLVFYGRRVRRLSKDSQDRIASVSAMSGESLSAIRVVQANTHEDADKAVFNESTEQAFKIAVNRIAARAFLVACVIILVFGATCLMFWVGGRDVLLGKMSAGTLAEFVFYAIVVAGALGAISEVYGELQRAAGASERLSELLSLVPEIRDPEIPEVKEPEIEKPQTQGPAASRNPSVPQDGVAIRFDNVRFTYPAKPGHPALSGVSFEIPHGQKVAIVGPSGAGKSTVFQLLLRFYDTDPAGGSVQVFGHDVRRLKVRTLREQFSWVSQDTVIFSGTLAENIAYGRPGAGQDDIIKAAEAANVMEFAGRLTDGLNTNTGEKGVRLSGGQRQRIALARAILRDAPVLLLDEATSALDPQNERSVQEALNRAGIERTCLIIAHRFSTIKTADRVLVFEQGRLVEDGTRTELARKKDGLFARLSDLQS